MSFYAQNQGEEVNLQSTLSSATSDTALAGPIDGPHHPITCIGKIRIHEDNGIECEHSYAPPENPRNQAILDATIAILLIEQLHKKF
jgi:hypothetical protein